MQTVETLEDHQEDDRDHAEAERNRDARHQHQQRDDEDERPLRGGTHPPPPSAFSAWARAIASASCFGWMPNGCARPVATQISSATYCRVRRASPIGIAR